MIKLTDKSGAAFICAVSFLPVWCEKRLCDALLCGCGFFNMCLSDFFQLFSNRDQQLKKMIFFSGGLSTSDLGNSTDDANLFKVQMICKYFMKSQEVQGVSFRYQVCFYVSIVHWERLKTSLSFPNAALVFIPNKF